MRQRLLIATGSPHKLGELSAMLDLPNSDLVSLTDVGLPDSADETGATFEDNARIKALHYAGLSGLPTLADDSGIEVDALGGRPGVKTRRYAGPDATDEQNNRKLLAEMDGFYGPDERTARYQCVLVFAEPTRLETMGAGDFPFVADVTRGTMEGRVAAAPRGTGGFGYDPIFEPDFEPPGGRTVAQLTPEHKNEVSHRSKAARAMREKLIARGY
jgi:XTP/dITP diphosphohydrolase